MMYPPSMKQIAKPGLNIKQMQRLIMSQQMQQALHFLELPIMELESLIQEEIDQNPLLEQENENPSEIEETIENEKDTTEQELDFYEHDFKIMEQLDREIEEHFKQNETLVERLEPTDNTLKNYLDTLVQERKSLFTHLMEECREIFETEEDLKKAEHLIGNFDEHGFLKTPLKEIALLNGFNEENLRSILEKIQTLEPKGVGATSLQESLLIQLKIAGKSNSLAFKILENYYEDLLHRRTKLIAKKLETNEDAINQAIEEISKLDLNPGLNFKSQTLQYIVPDMTIQQDGDSFQVIVNEDPLPPLKLNPRYLKLLEDKTLQNETKEFIEKKIASMKWMLKNLTERNETLVKIGHEIVKKQANFLQDPKGELKPLTMQEVASSIGLHESTVTRAVSSKYVNTPKGLIPLRAFFSSSLNKEDGSIISQSAVKDEILAIIKNENKDRPFSDETISKMLKDKGIICARRTIAKYRQALNLGTKQQRKKILTGK